MAGIETKPKTPNNRSGQHCRNACRTVSGVRKRLSGRLAILIVISHPVCVRKSVSPALPAYQSVRQLSQKSCFFVYKMLDFLEWLANYLNTGGVSV
jgi:hypothetical protein